MRVQGAPPKAYNLKRHWTQSIDMLPTAIILVDPISFGYTLHRHARRKGYKCISLVTFDDCQEHCPLTVYAPQMKREFQRETGEGFDQVIQLRPGETVSQIVSRLLQLELDFRAVIPGSDLGVELADAIAAELDLHHNDPNLIEARRHKAAMKECAARFGLNVGGFERCVRAEEAVRFASVFGFPIVLKTPAGAGSHLVFVCRNESEIRERHRQILESLDFFGRCPDHAVAEEYLDGDEYQVNLFADGSSLVVTDVWRAKKVDNSFASNLYSQVMLVRSPSSELEPILRYAIDVARAVGIKIGAAHVELKVDPTRGPRLIEIAPRLSGARIPELIEQFSEFDPFGSTIDVFVNGSVGLPAPITSRCHLAVVHCISTAGGKVTGIRGLDEIRSLESFFDEACALEVGKAVNPTTDLTNYPLTVWMRNEDSARLTRDADEVQRLFQFDVAPEGSTN